MTTREAKEQSNREAKEQLNSQYIANKVNPLLEKLVVDLLIHKPENSLDFMQDWLKEKGPKIFHDFCSSSKVHKMKNAYGEESEEEEEEEISELIDKKEVNKGSKNSRTSVSAEAYGQYLKKSEYKPRVIPKNAQQIERIRSRLEQAFMFSALEPKEQEVVINSFEEKNYKPGDVVIKQGDDGDNLYIVDLGDLDCFKKFANEAEPRRLKTYFPGDSFGELALLYNAPRAATIIAKTDAICFALDRECFNHIVKDAASKKREIYEKFLGKVELLDQMDPYERSKIADALKPLKFKKGDFVVKEGEKGDTFYFVEEGEAVATKILKADGPAEVVYHYKQGDYFGELALLRDTPRAANIIAKTDLSVVGMNRQSFKRLLGPLEDILKRNFQRYEKFMS